MTPNASWFLIPALVVLILSANKWLPWVGHLPGDFTFHCGRATVFMPLGTGLLISIILSVLVAVMSKR